MGTNTPEQEILLSAVFPKSEGVPVDTRDRIANVIRRAYMNEDPETTRPMPLALADAVLDELGWNDAKQVTMVLEVQGVGQDYDDVYGYEIDFVRYPPSRHENLEGTYRLIREEG